MGLLSSLEGMAEGQGGGNAQAATGVMQALDEHPGGLSGVLQHFEQNGMGGQVQQWATGEQQTATPAQVQQGLAGSGFVERVAEKAGVSPQVAETAIATVLPMVIAHFTQGGQVAPPASGFGGMAGSILSRIL